MLLDCSSGRVWIRWFLFETSLLEPYYIVVYRPSGPASLFLWQFELKCPFHSRNCSANIYKAKVLQQTALFYAASQVRVKQMGKIAMACVGRDAVVGVHGTPLRQWWFALKAA